MGITLIAVTSVTLHGRIIQPETKFTCDEHYAKKLIAGGSAKIFNAETPKSNENGSNGNGNGQKNNRNGESNSTLTTEETAKKFDKMLRDDLILLAEKHKIELKKDTTKPEIIKKLVEADVKPDEEDI